NSGERSGLGGLWLLLAPLACCGGPFLIAGLAAAGALDWGGGGLGVAVLVAGAVLGGRRWRPRPGPCRARAAGRGGDCRWGGPPAPGGAMTTANPPARSATARAAPARPWLAVTREAAGDRINQMVFVAVAAVAGFGYSMLLPFDYTQRVSFANWQYFGLRYAAFTAPFALGLAWVGTPQVHAMPPVAPNAAGRPPRGGPDR